MWKYKALKWCGWSGGSLFLFVLLCTGLFVWAATEYTRYRPLDLTARIALVDKYLMPEALSLSADKAELFFDDGPVLHVSGLGIKGADGSLGVFVENAAVKFASTQLLLLSAAPKMIEANGVTLRLVRDADRLSIAGLGVAEKPDAKLGEKREIQTSGGVVGWLNGLVWNRVWGRLKGFKIDGLNLLVRDDVQGTEWVLEDGRLAMSRYPDDGEEGTLSAYVRRLYGDGTRMNVLDNVPVLVSFNHAPGAEGLDIKGRLDRADARMVADYFPPQFKDLLKARGQVEIGTRLLEGNRLELPWLTLRLRDVKVHPEELFSAPLEFPKMTLTASYVPPVEGVSDTDILNLRKVELLTKRGAEVVVSGTISGLQSGDPLIDLSLASPKGPVQGVFDFFPDKTRPMAKTLKWVRPNIQKGDYTNVTAHFKGRPSFFPGCGDACGVLDIDADFQDAKVSFLTGISAVTAENGHYRWRGQTFTVTADKGFLNGQAARDVVVEMRQIFAPAPTVLRVTGKLDGPVAGAMAELNNIPEITGKVPLGIGGRHSSYLDITVPLPRGDVPATFGGSTVLVSSTIADVSVKDLRQLKGLDFTGPMASVSLDAAKRLRVQTQGQLGGLPMAVDWSQSIAPNTPDAMALDARGTVAGSWLLKHVSTTQITLDGPVGVNLKLREQNDKNWLFDATADAARAEVGLPAVKYVKPAGRGAFSVEARGSYAEDVKVVLEKLDVVGKDLSAGGAVEWFLKEPAKSLVSLPHVRIGQTDVSVVMSDKHMQISGSFVDLRGYDVFGDDEVSASDVAQQDSAKESNFDGMRLTADVKSLLLKGGELNDIFVKAHAAHGDWNMDLVAAKANGANVSIVRTPLGGQRSRLTMNMDDLGSTLAVLGLYDQLKGGSLRGEIAYDTPTVGGGVIQVENFELQNPSLLVQILSLMSLEQLLTGTTSTMFKSALVPLRVDGKVYHLDNARLEGPSMDIRLDGMYDRGQHQLNIDGKMAPGIPLNRLVSKIPVLGAVLTGSQDGLVVADFKVKGSTSDPQVNVRPLSVITPGLLKDVFRGISNLGAEAVAKPEVQDGRSQ